MKNSLGKTEIMGLIFLALLIVGITGCALLVRDCAGSKTGGLDPAPVAIDTIRVEIQKAENGDADGNPRKATGKGKQGNKSRKKGAAKKSTKKKAPAERPDPFKDTIPRN